MIAAAAVLSMAATCWVWGGNQTRSLGVDEALSLMRGSEQERQAAVVVFSREAKTHIERLRNLAIQQDDVGAAARVALARLQELTR